MRSMSVALLATVLACEATGGTSNASTESDGDSTDGSDDIETTQDDGGFVPESDLLAPDDGPVDSHAEDMQPIWNNRCVLYCHAVGMDPPAGDLDLFEGAYEHLVNQPSGQLPAMMLVTPGNPDQSYLWQKLIGNHLNVGGQGETMPLNAPILDEDTLERVEAWILVGAPP
jgi:hypothetical protein